MGEFVAWIIGWDLVLEYALGAATVAVSWSQYVDKFLANYGIHIPQSILHGPWDTKPGIINLPSILIICLLLLLMRGTKESASLNNILVILKVTVFIGLGWGFINANHTLSYQLMKVKHFKLWKMSF
jgi:APA family basic amino acid/polyamine antiporter